MSRDFNSSAALASLTETYTDSDISDEESRDTPHHRPRFTPSDENSSQSNAGGKESKNVSSLVSYINDEDIEKEDDEDPEKAAKLTFYSPITQIKQDKETTIAEEESAESIKDFTSSLRRTSADEIQLPPEPVGRCANHLQENIIKHYEKKARDGLDLNNVIQKRKDFRNPSIYEKLITFCLIDELGTNYPPDIYDPHAWKDDSFYEELAKAQKTEMDKRQKERTKVEFVSGTKKTNVLPIPLNDHITEEKKRKSKWDVGAIQTTSIPSVIKPFISHPPGIVPVTTTASGTKATVISAFGTITKKAKQ